MTIDMNPTVRKAVAEDYPEIMHLAQLLHEENGLFEMSKPKMDWLLSRVLMPESIPEGDPGPRGWMGVIGPVGGPLEGLILFCLGQYWYSDSIFLEEYANFVHPHYRKSEHAHTLCKYAQHVSDEIGIPLLIGVLSNKRTEAKVRLYRRYFPEVGAFFLHNGPGSWKQKAKKSTQSGRTEPETAKTEAA